MFRAHAGLARSGPEWPLFHRLPDRLPRPSPLTWAARAVTVFALRPAAGPVPPLRSPENDGARVRDRTPSPFSPFVLFCPLSLSVPVVPPTQLGQHSPRTGEASHDPGSATDCFPQASAPLEWPGQMVPVPPRQLTFPPFTASQKPSDTSTAHP